MTSACLLIESVLQENILSLVRELSLLLENFPFQKGAGGTEKQNSPVLTVSGLGTNCCHAPRQPPAQESPRGLIFSAFTCCPSSCPTVLVPTGIASVPSQKTADLSWMQPRSSCFPIPENQQGRGGSTVSLLSSPLPLHSPSTRCQHFLTSKQYRFPTIPLEALYYLYST